MKNFASGVNNNIECIIPIQIHRSLKKGNGIIQNANIIFRTEKRAKIWM